MKKSTLKFLIRVGVSLALILFLYRRIDAGSLATRLHELHWLPLAALLGVFLVNTLISAIKWRIFLAADGMAVSLRSLFASYLTASFFGMFLPSTIGGDAYRVYDLSRNGRTPAHIFASVLADRLSGFLALSMLAIVFPLLGYRLIDRPILLAVPLAVLALLGGVVWSLCERRLLERAMVWLHLDRFERLTAFVGRFLDSMAVYRRNPGLLGKAMAISFLFQFNVIVAIDCMTQALRLEIPFPVLCVFVPIVSLLEAVPISIYGVGIRDSGYMFFFAQIGHAREEAAALSILYVVSSFVYAALGGIVYVLRPRREWPTRSRETPG